MIIDNECKDNIKRSYLMGEYDQAYRKLFKLNNKILETIEDVYFVKYHLSLMCKKLKRYEEAKIYIDEIKLYLDETYGFTTEKGKVLWLYIELYKNELSDDILLRDYEELKIYYNNLDKLDEFIIGIDISIGIIQQDYVKVELLLETCLNMNYIENIKNLFYELKESDKNIFSKLLNKVDKNMKLA